MKTSIQKIIVPLDPSRYAKAATIRACHVAKAHEATLTGVTVLDSPGIRSHITPVDPYLPVLIEENVRQFIENAKEQIDEVRTEFRQTCDNANIPHAEPRLEGVPASMILDASALHDLVVVGLRTFFHFETSPGPGDSLAKLLHRTVTPILAVPGDDAGKPFQRALITYDGSMNSARALRDFIQFAVPFDLSLTILCAEKDEQRATWLLEEASSYLHAHGRDRFETIHIKEKNIPDEALNDYDLIALGIHSKRFFTGSSIGGFTDKMIERNDTSLFLSH